MAEKEISVSGGGFCEDGAGRLTVEVLEVGELDPLAHAEHVGRRAEAIKHHPDVARIQCADLLGCLTCLRIPAIRRQSMLNVRPSSNHAAQDHETKTQQGHTRDGAAEPQHLAVGDQDDGQVFKDGVDRDAEKLEGFGGSVDHADEEEGDREPFASFVCVEVAEGDDVGLFSGLNGDDADDALEQYPVSVCHPVSMWVPSTQRADEHTCTHSKKKFKLKPVPLRTYLFVTVMRILLPQ